ncbi:hypothetical protein [Burkholderia ubonensis]|uniref:hypothetical protein n=1 Tax=Burkholderia ubonensis TaxID=101571 RepID=UPI000F58BB62|nr:hypothetical protein [Burkholderia ubonensis]
MPTIARRPRFANDRRGRKDDRNGHASDVIPDHSNHINARRFSTRKQGRRKILRDKTGMAATLAFLNEVA